MEVADPTLYAVILLIINGGLQWIRELRKGRLTSGNGKDLKEIKESINLFDGKLTAIDSKVGETTVKIAEVKTAVNLQKSQCSATIQRFDKAIGDQNQTLINLAGRKR